MANILFILRMIEEHADDKDFDLNCVDPLNRSALISAIENENIDLVHILLDKGIKVKVYCIKAPLAKMNKQSQTVYVELKFCMWNKITGRSAARDQRGIRGGSGRASTMGRATPQGRRTLCKYQFANSHTHTPEAIQKLGCNYKQNLCVGRAGRRWTGGSRRSPRTSLRWCWRRITTITKSSKFC